MYSMLKVRRAFEKDGRKLKGLDSFKCALVVINLSLSESESELLVSAEVTVHPASWPSA